MDKSNFIASDGMMQYINIEQNSTHQSYDHFQRANETLIPTVILILCQLFDNCKQVNYVNETMERKISVPENIMDKFKPIRSKCQLVMSVIRKLLPA